MDGEGELLPVHVGDQVRHAHGLLHVVVGQVAPQADRVGVVAVGADGRAAVVAGRRDPGGGRRGEHRGEERGGVVAHDARHSRARRAHSCCRPA